MSNETEHVCDDCAHDDMQDQMVVFLERLLVLAKAGDISCLLVTGEQSGEKIFARVLGSNSYPEMIGMLDILKTKLLADFLEMPSVGLEEETKPEEAGGAN